MFHIPRRDRQLQQQKGRRPIVRAVAVILRKSIISSAHGMCIRKRLPREGGVHVGIEDGCQGQDAFAVEKLSCVHRGILDSFTGYAYGDAGQQESKKTLHGAMDSAVVVTGSKARKWRLCSVAEMETGIRKPQALRRDWRTPQELKLIFLNSHL